MKIQIPAFAQARVLVVGDLMLDRYWHGPTSRISPEAPVPVVHVREVEERPGGAGNVARNIAALGSHAHLISVSGDDEAANALESGLVADGVQCELMRVKEIPTITKLRVMSRHQQLMRLDFEESLHAFDTASLLNRCEQAFADATVVLLSDYGKGTLRAVHELIHAARAAGKPVLVDPKGSDFARYSGATLLTPNQAEFEAVVGGCRNDEELVEKGEALRRELSLEALLITRSERGMTLLRENCEALHLPTRAREVFDVTGAGDTVIATLASAMAAGADLVQATALANLAAGIVVGKLGTASVSVEEIRNALRDQNAIERGVVSEAQLQELLAEARAHGERIIMTNGCFDILHAGHVTYLQQAAALGDRLIVAVNDDASVKRLKGPERPVNSMAQRMFVLAGLECVDWVVPFVEDTPTRLICALSPDVLVKGGDNDPDRIPGGDCVRKAGGEVRVMTYVDEMSTTGIIRSIRERGDS